MDRGEAGLLVDGVNFCGFGDLEDLIEEFGACVLFLDEELVEVALALFGVGDCGNCFCLLLF